MSMVELHVEAVAIDWKGNPIIVLRELGGPRKIFIWVGLPEATAISMHLEGQDAPRPLTHDLIGTILTRVGARVERITITAMEKNTYYAELNLKIIDRVETIDCRPSDAIAVALRAEAPILIDNDLLETLDAARREETADLSPDATVVDSGEPTVH